MVMPLFGIIDRLCKYGSASVSAACQNANEEVGIYPRIRFLLEFNGTYKNKTVRTGLSGKPHTNLSNCCNFHIKRTMRNYQFLGEKHGQILIVTDMTEISFWWGGR